MIVTEVYFGQMRTRGQRRDVCYEVPTQIHHSHSETQLNCSWTQYECPFHKWTKKNFFMNLCELTIIVPTPLEGEGLYTQMGFFCSDNFGRLIYSSLRNVSGIIKKLVQRRIRNWKDFLKFIFFSRTYRGLKVHVNTGYLVHLCSLLESFFVRINIFSMKILIQNYLSRYKMHQFGVPTKRKAIRKTSSGLIGKLSEKFEIYLRAEFFRQILKLFCFLSH